MSAIPNIENTAAGCRPLLKWAGGKTQLLPRLVSLVPKTYNRYIEPFFGGGALFFALEPRDAIIADSNPELINLYQAVASDVDRVRESLAAHKNSEDYFYEVRAQDWTQLSPCDAASRTLFLNRTCFNGLYRVNRAGQFNVPFGRYKKWGVDENNLRQAALALSRAKIVCGDYKSVLKEHAAKDDFVFLDPPYMPVSQFADFKRYTKEQFRESDHVELAAEIERLRGKGCHVVLTNSNHPLVQRQYEKYGVEVVPTKRYISCNGSKRTGEDVVVTIPPKRKPALRLVAKDPNEQLAQYPATRYMGSKSKLLDAIWSVSSQFSFNTCLDLFSGSGVVGYMFKTRGKAVVSNDYMAMSATFTRAMIENASVKLGEGRARGLLDEKVGTDRFVERTFKGLYFTDAENRLIDRIRTNIASLANPYEQAVARAALIRACIKKRPRGIFTYTGQRYDDGRKDLQTSLRDHFLNAVAAINGAIFDNGQTCRALQGDALHVPAIAGGLIYIDPPYYSPYSDNEYVRRYHFVEGLARDWNGVEIQEHTSTKKFRSYPTPFSSKAGAAVAFLELFTRFRDNILLVSYSSNSQPTLEEMVALLKRAGKRRVDLVPVKHRYSFGTHAHKVGDNKNMVQEYLFIGH